jgi:hypothetical protein
VVLPNGNFQWRSIEFTSVIIFTSFSYQPAS